MGKIMRVNLSDLKVKVEEMPKEYQGIRRERIVLQYY